MVCGRIGWLFLSAVYVAVDSSNSIFEHSIVPTCVNESRVGYDMVVQVKQMIVTDDMNFTEPTHEAKCWMYCVFRMHRKLDKGGNYISKPSPGGNEIQLSQNRQCVEVAKVYSDKCEKTYQTYICIKRNYLSRPE